MDTPKGMSAKTAHSSIDDYFGQLVKTSQVLSECTYILEVVPDVLNVSSCS